MRTQTKVTVSIPTYNRAALLKVCLESVLAQDYPDFQVIVLDNASSDDTTATVNAFADPRIIYLRNDTNIGMHANWSRALEVNSSPYLTVLEDDDLILDGFIRESAHALDKHPSAGFSFGLCRYIDIKGTELNLQEGAGEIPETELITGLEYLHNIVAGRNWVIYPASVMMRSSAVATTGPLDIPHSYHSSDLNLYLRLASNFDLAYIPKEVACYRLHGGQDTELKFRSPGGTGQLAVLAERMDAIGYLLRSSRARDASYREWLAERLVDLNLRRSELTSYLVPHLNLTWMERLRIAIREIEALIPAEDTLILVDEDKWGTTMISGRPCIPFLEQDGKYWGPPRDDQTAIRELERLRRTGANYIVFGWPAFWWLDYFSQFHQHVRSQFRLVLKNSRLVVFDLRHEGGRANQ
jgi:glycosyltransferase involved in cell wall biosynthesis